MLGTPPWRFVREVLVPAASPMIFTGLRLSLQASWTTLVAAELVGALYGLGRVLNVAQQDIYPGMILVGMVAVARAAAGGRRWLLGAGGAPGDAPGTVAARDGTPRDGRAALASSRRSAYGAVGLAAFLGLWSALCVTGLVPRQFLPAPWEVVAPLRRAADRRPSPASRCRQHLGSSFQRYVYGRAARGRGRRAARPADGLVPAGSTTSSRRSSTRCASSRRSPGCRSRRSWFGTGIGGPIMIIFAGAFPPCLINAYRGARFVEPHLIEAARMLGTGNCGR